MAFWNAASSVSGSDRALAVFCARCAGFGELHLPKIRNAGGPCRGPVEPTVPITWPCFTRLPLPLASCLSASNEFIGLAVLMNM